MTHDTGSFKKVAVLTGLMMVIGGAEISTADAATTTPQIFPFNLSGSGVGPPELQPLFFHQFNSSLGTLTGVNFSLDSTITNDVGMDSTASVTVSSVLISSQSFGQGVSPYDDSGISGLTGAANAAFYTGTSTFAVSLMLEMDGDGSANWDGQFGAETGLTLTYQYDPVSQFPLPAALPLFATGLAGLGLLGWRRKRKPQATVA